MNSRAVFRELPVPQQRFLLITEIPLECINLMLVAAVASGSCIDVIPPFACIEKVIGRKILLSGKIEVPAVNFAFCSEN